MPENFEPAKGNDHEERSPIRAGSWPGAGEVHPGSWPGQALPREAGSGFVRRSALAKAEEAAQAERSSAKSRPSGTEDSPKGADVARGIVKWLVDVVDETGETVALATILTMVKKMDQS